MTRDEWHQIKNVLEAAWENETDERARFIHEISALDGKLRSTVEALLASDQNAGEFLDTPALLLSIDLEPADFDDSWLGRYTGPYRILHEIGHGGMGTVYLAERADGRYEKQVAIKIVSPQFGDRQFLRRFLRERQVLATLDHPNIARLLDGGETPDGLPYLVMEHVTGERIDAWCDSRKLPVRDRLRLFRNVCAAVQYAHEKHVIHRDIKPGNILVTSDGTPKLVDFGIAKVLSPEPSGDTREMTLGRGPITPECASPEQVRGERIGPKADVYALGVLLYRLLTGQLPYRADGDDPGEIMRAVCEQEPVKPSGVVRDRKITKDVDSIVLKALRKEPDQRYPSVAELSDEVERFLANRPVRARKDTFVYRWRKFLRRNRWPFITAASTAALVLGLLAPLWLGNARFAADWLMARTLGRPFPAASGEAAPGTTNAEALRAYEEGLRERARFQRVATYKALERAVALDPQFLAAQYQLADAMQFWGNLSQARRVIAHARQLAEASTVSRLEKLLIESLHLRVDLQLDEAAKVLQSAHLAFARETEPLLQLAYIRNLQGRFAEAATLLEEVTRINPRHALAQIRLAYAYAYEGQLARALACIDRYAALLPPGPGSEVPFWSRAEIYMINERYDDAISQYRSIGYSELLAQAAVVKGDYTLAESTLATITNKRRGWYSAAGHLATARGELDRAVVRYEEAANLYRAEGPLRPWWALLCAARIFLEQRQPDRLLALGRRHTTPWAAGLRGTALLLQGKGRDAEKEFAMLRDSITPILGANFAGQAIEFHRLLAASYSENSDQVIQILPKLPSSFWSAYALDAGRAYLRTGLFTEAEHHLRMAQLAQRAFFMDMDRQDQHDSLTWMLARFYLGQVSEKTGGRNEEKTGRHNEAIANYESFVKHFEHSPARLPQILVARSFLERFQFSERGSPVFAEEFSGAEVGAGCTTTAGTWEISGGVANVSERRTDQRHPVCSRPLVFRDAILELSFRLDGDSEIYLDLYERSGHLTGLAVTPLRIEITPPASAFKTQDKSDVGRFATLRTEIEPGKWHKVVLEIKGKRMIAQLDGSLKVCSDNPGVDVEKAGIKLLVTSGSASFDYLRVYKIRTRRT